jgi:hypothetical protein
MFLKKKEINNDERIEKKIDKWFKTYLYETYEIPR